MNIEEATLNCAIDFGATLVFGVAAYFDLKKGAELNDRVATKLASTGVRVAKSKASDAKFSTSLSSLLVSLPVSSTERRTASVSDLQQNAKQSLVLLAGPKAFLSESLLAARLAKPSPFTINNALLVAFDSTEVEDASSEEDAVKGFGGKNAKFAPYLAEPISKDAWKDFFDSEFNDAAEQGGDASKAREQGMVILVGSDGKVKRRGLGVPPFKTLFDELN